MLGRAARPLRSPANAWIGHDTPAGNHFRVRLAYHYSNQAAAFRIGLAFIVDNANSREVFWGNVNDPAAVPFTRDRLAQIVAYERP